MASVNVRFSYYIRYFSFLSILGLLLSGCGSPSPQPSATATVTATSAEEPPKEEKEREIEKVAISEDLEANPEIVLLRQAEEAAENLRMLSSCLEIVGPVPTAKGTIARTSCETRAGTIVIFRFGKGTSNYEMLDHLRSRGDYYYQFLEDGSGVVTWMSLLISYRQLTGVMVYGNSSFPIIARGLGELWCMEVVATGGSYNENKSAPNPCS